MTPLENISYSHQPGTIIDGKYQLEAMLGEGGMATVWRAQHVLLRKAVAIKLVRSDLRLGELTQRLILEAQVEAQLSHPNVVRVSDFGQTEDGTAFMVMELLRGRSLADEMAHSGAMDPEQSVRLLLPLIDALACAHEAGIVHRDVKPENIFLALGDDDILRPKLVDFGIAKLASGGFDSRITQRGMLLGSPAYMAPEQARGEEDVDFRSDLWSIAVVLYEMVTGHALFSGSNFQAVLRAVVEDEVRPLPATSDGMITLWPILERALRKSRIDRFDSARELGQSLARWLIARGITTDISGVSIEPMARLQTVEGAALRARALDVAAPRLAPRITPFDRALTQTQPGRRIAPRRALGSRALFAVAAAAALGTVALTGMSSAARSGTDTEVPGAEQLPLPPQVEPKPEPRPTALELEIPPEALDARVEIAGATRTRAIGESLLVSNRAGAPREPADVIERSARSESAPLPAKRLGLKDPY